MKKIKIGFFTGWRCEYGLSVSLLKQLDSDTNIHLLIYPNGLHLLDKFGHTVDEIERDGFTIGEKINTYSEIGDEKVFELTNSINNIYKALQKANLDGIIVCGDRIEAYAVALAAHFSGLPIFHIGGGVITKGAVDNIYRYNISNLSTTHFVTCSSAFDRLCKMDTIDQENIYFTGSTAIEQIFNFIKNPTLATDIIPNLKNDNFCLMTFHPVTLKLENIGALMDYSIELILNRDTDIVITYPNNDDGTDDIQKIIRKWENHRKIHVIKSLGSKSYYSLICSTGFVIGNSSSGVIEVPYFNKISLNVGSRQDGREKDHNVVDVKPTKMSVKKSLLDIFNGKIKSKKCNELFGNGNSSIIMTKIIKEKLIDAKY